MELGERSNRRHEPKEEEKKSFLNGKNSEGTNVTFKSGRRRPCLRNGCIVAGCSSGALLILLGCITVFVVPEFMRSVIEKSMALSRGSDRFESWLRPPVQPHLTAYAFSVMNPESVARGAKPRLQEIGPFVYKSTTLKDTDNNIQWTENDDVMEYSPRKMYYFVPEMSILDPDTTYVTVPNIPLWTGVNKMMKVSGYAREIVRDLLTSGRGTPFVNVSISGLLWGYKDELPCLKLNVPAGCEQGTDGPFSNGNDDDWGDDFGSDFDSDDNDDVDSGFEEEKVDGPSMYDNLVKKNPEFVGCNCHWGLFRDRNVTMRNPVKFRTGVSDLSAKGRLLAYNGKTHLGFWEKDSTCDRVRGTEGTTLPPGLTPKDDLEIFIPLMCRPLTLKYEGVTEHAGIRAHRYIPPLNALGSHDDPDPEKANPDNACYCVESEGFECFKSGVYNMEPCKRDKGAPLALSYPHFYQADPSFLEAVDGLNPDEEKHRFFMDIVPEFGFPLAIRPRFQLNILIDGADTNFAAIAGVRRTLLPFLWAQDGFDEPSIEMAAAIRFGLSAPEKLTLYISVICFCLGSVLLLISIAYFLWVKYRQSH